MVAPTIVLALQGALSASVMIGGGIFGLMAASLLAKQPKEFWSQSVNQLGDTTGLLIFILFLIVGIYSEILANAQLTQGLVWLADTLHIGPALFALFIYIACSVLGTAMGTSVGTILVMTPVFYPASVAIGCDPILVLGAILSGAATGDHFAPISDTTIISASTQHYYHKEGTAEVSDVVRGRLRYAAPAFLLSCVFYLLAGFWHAEAGNQTVPAVVTGSPIGLVMIVPMVVVIAMAIRGRSVFEALTYGTFTAILLALGFDLIQLNELLYVEGRSVNGLLVEGVLKNMETIIMIMLMMSAYGVARSYGLLDKITAFLRGMVGRSLRQTEFVMLGIGAIFNFLLIGLTARIAVIAGPIINEIGRPFAIHPVRRANILDAATNSFSYIVPWHVWPLLMVMTAAPIAENYPSLSLPSPTDFLLITAYPVAIWLVMCVAIYRGAGRKTETGLEPNENQHAGQIRPSGAHPLANAPE
ncbi:Na+/H+ antiporter NhaC family protein [Microbulbifer agarilyticus]